jgi:aromatic ring-opening dioxygenase catalytic subunit (LigB family)
MTVEQILLEKWRSLPPDKQQEVFDFVEFLQSRQVSLSQKPALQEAQSKLGERLQQIREKIVASGTLLLTDEEIDREVAERRGGYQESE